MSKVPSATGELLRCRTVARLLDVTIKHVYRLIEKGDLATVRIGPRQLRVTRSSLTAFLEALNRDDPPRSVALRNRDTAAPGSGGDNPATELSQSHIRPS